MIELGQQSPHQLVEFLTAVSRQEQPAGAVNAAAELAAEEFDAEVGAVVIGDELRAAVGFGAGAVPELSLRVTPPGAGVVELPGVGACHYAASSWDMGERGRLMVARLDPEFSPEERNLLLGMARGLGLTLRMIDVLDRERESRRLLEVLLGIQRSISHRAPLPEILCAVTEGTSSLLGGRPVSLYLDDELDPEHPIVAGPDLGGDDGAAAPVHVNGVPAGALVAASGGSPLAESERRLLAAFAEHASLALTDARTVEAMREAFHDPLTGLPNRALFLDRLTHALQVSNRQEARLSVLFVDLDRFKAVNDSIGHAAGDTLLRAVAQRIVSCTRDADTAARFGGDEFAVLLEATDPLVEAPRVAERIIAAVRRPFTIGGKVVFVGATVGIAYADGSALDADELLRNADLAMYRAKKTGRGRWTAFEPAMRAALIARMDLEADLQTALSRGELAVHYQPLVELDGERPVSLEALLRWTHPTKGPMSPADFIPVAEETGAILEIGDWVLREACAQLAAWRRTMPWLTVSVNVSAGQLRDDGYLQRVEQALAEHGLPWEALTLEITETMLIEDRGETGEQLDELKRRGAAIALDDFGTGYSSLRYLRQFPVDLLKIDRSFVQGMPERPQDGALIHTIVELGRTLGLVTVAEGIETPEQLARLREMGCSLGQGFHFARPMDPAAATAFLERR